MKSKDMSWLWGVLLAAVLLFLAYGLLHYIGSLQQGDNENPLYGQDRVDDQVEQLKLEHQNYSIDVPTGWEKVSDGSTANNWSTVTYWSPDLEIADIPETNATGGVISISVSPVAKESATIEEIMSGEAGDKISPLGLSVENTVANPRRVTIGGLPAVEYVWKGPGEQLHVASVQKDGLYYSIDFFDEKQFSNYSEEYYSIVNSFRFLK